MDRCECWEASEEDDVEKAPMKIPQNPDSSSVLPKAVTDIEFTAGASIRVAADDTKVADGFYLLGKKGPYWRSCKTHSEMLL